MQKPESTTVFRATNNEADKSIFISSRLIRNADELYDKAGNIFAHVLSEDQGLHSTKQWRVEKIGLYYENGSVLLHVIAPNNGYDSAHRSLSALVPEIEEVLPDAVKVEDSEIIKPDSAHFSHLHPADIVYDLKIHGEQKEALSQAIDQLCMSGVIAPTAAETAKAAVYEDPRERQFSHVEAIETAPASVEGAAR